MLRKTLYVLILSGPLVDTMHLFYSEGAYEANEQANDLQQEHGGKRVSLTEWPSCFKLVTAEIPGTIMVPDDEPE